MYAVVYAVVCAVALGNILGEGWKQSAIRTREMIGSISLCEVYLTTIFHLPF